MVESDELPRKQLLEITVGDSETQLSRMRGIREVSAKPVGEPEPRIVDSYGTKTSLHNELRLLRDDKYPNADAYVLSSAISVRLASSNKQFVAVQFYQIQRKE